MVLRQALGVDHGRRCWQGVAQRVMIGQYHGNAGIRDELDVLVFSDAGVAVMRVAGDEEVEALIQVTLEDSFGDPMGFFGAARIGIW